MRVLHVSHQYPPAIGGSERYIADLSEELVARGHQVDVFTSRSRDFHSWRTELPVYDEMNGVKVYRYRSLQRRDYVWRILHFSLGRYWHNRAWWWEPFIFLGGGPLCPGLFLDIWHHGRRYDLIHLNCLVYGHVLYGYWVAKRIHLPIIVTPHAHAEQEVTYNLGYQRRVLFGADHVLADTPAERDLLLSLKLPTTNVSLGGVGLHPTRYPLGEPLTARRALGLPDDAYVFLFLGRKDKYKGLEMVLRAFTRLQPKHPHLHCLAVGPETDDSRQLWPEYEKTHNLHVFGAVSEAEKLNVLRACDCLVLPSVGEAFGIVFLEAWMMRKPVIGARVLAVGNVIDDERTGLLALPDDPESLAQCMERLILQPTLGHQLGQAGHVKVMAHYTVPKITDRVEAIYQNILTSTRPGEK
jgi:glycosyltransferase involved in cell wall biosynthesis